MVSKLTISKAQSIIDKSQQKLIEKLRSEGINDKTIKNVIENNKKIYDCPYCGTSNMVEVYQTGTFTRYQCFNCDCNGYKYYIELR